MKDQYLRSIPSQKLQALLQEKSKREDRGQPFDSLQQWHEWIEKDIKQRDFVAALSSQVKGSLASAPPSTRVEEVVQNPTKKSDCNHCRKLEVPPKYRIHREENCWKKFPEKHPKNGGTSGKSSYLQAASKQEVGPQKNEEKNSKSDVQEPKKPDPYCKKCKKKGHWTSDCKQSKSDNNSEKPAELKKKE